MKKVFSFIVVALLTAGVMFAQDFNGTIKYSFNIEGEGVEQFQSMMPTGMTMTYLKQDMIMEMEGGMVAMMMGKMLFHGKKGKGYMIKDSEETIYTMSAPKGEEAEEEGEAPEIKKTDETMNIAGYECTKYEIITEGPMGPQTGYAWATEKIKPAKPKKGNSMSMGGMGGMNMKGLPGMPLKMEMATGPMTIVIEAKEVDTNTPDKKLFKLPKGYDKEEFNPNMFGGGGGGGMGF